MLTQICIPALIYLVFSITQISIDSVQGLYNLAFVKLWVAFIFTILLNYLCQLGLGIVSWLIVFIPFILMTVIVAMLLLMLGLDPRTGRIRVPRKRRRERDDREMELRREERELVRKYDELRGRAKYEPSESGEKHHKHRGDGGVKKAMASDVRRRAGLMTDPLQSDN